MSALAALRRPRGLALRAPGLLGPELAGVALADWLFWRRDVGLSLPLFCFAVAAFAAALRPGRPSARRPGRAAVILVLAVAPAVERMTGLSAAFALVGTAFSLHVLAGPQASGRLRDVARDLLSGPRRVVGELLRRRRSTTRRRAAPERARARWLAWVAPLGLLAAFGALLADADPLIGIWIADLPIPSFADVVGALPRALFWLVVLVKLWPLLRARRRARRAAAALPEAGGSLDSGGLERLASALLSPVAVIRTLLLLCFAVGLQLGLDGAFLWGGLALPRGLTYAAYAHRGAYPLVATALLAGAVALAIRRPGAPAPSGLAAGLLLLFLAENVLLVGSAVARLSLYVAAYTLTEWRVAAFAWMGLVAAGLCLVTLQGTLGRDARWLLRANALAALVVLYGWCFLDVPRLVASYDVAHCAELKGEGPSLDVRALMDLGPEAVPALDRFLLGFTTVYQREAVERWRARMARDVRDQMFDWRGWSLAGHRLRRHLDASGVAEPAVQVDDDGGS